MRRVGIYVRVSTEEQAEVVEGSIKNQPEILEKFVQAENMKHDGTWGKVVDTYIDDGYSAKDLRRPEVKRLLRDIHFGKIDTVLITEISRLSRCVEHWIQLRRFFDEREVSILAARQNFDTSTAMGRAMLNFAIEFAQLEREMTAERVKASYNARAGRGLWTGGPIPFGFDSVREGVIEVNEAKRIIANDMLDILVNKAGDLSRALEKLTEAGYRRDGGKEWDEKTLANWIRHHALVGKREINKKNKEKDQGRLPEAERYRVVGASWGELVDHDLWERANEILDKNYQKLKVGQWKYHDFALVGILECPGGHRLVGSSGTGRSGKKYVHYRHPNKAKCSCHVGTLPAKTVDDAVLRRLRGLVVSPEVVADITANANKAYQSERPDYESASLSCRRRLAGVKTKMDRVTDQILETDDLVEREAWRDKMRSLQSERQAIEHELREIEGRAKEIAQVLNPREIVSALDAFFQGYNDLPIAARQTILASILESVRVERDELVLVIKNPNFSLGSADAVDVNLEIAGFAQREEWLAEGGRFRTRLSSPSTPQDLRLYIPSAF